MNFINFKSVIDTTHGERIWKRLESTNKTFSNNQCMFETARGKLQITVHRSDEFEMTNGVKQGVVFQPTPILNNNGQNSVTSKWERKLKTTAG